MVPSLTPRASLAAVVALCAGRACRRGEAAPDLWDWLDRGCRRLVDTYEKRRQRAARLRLRLAHAVDVDAGEARRGKRERLGRRLGPHGRATRTATRDTVFVPRLQRLAQQAAVQPRLRMVDVLGRAQRHPAGARATRLMLVAAARHRQRLAVPRRAAARSRCATTRRRSFTTYIPTLGGGINNGSILYVFGTRSTLD